MEVIRVGNNFPAGHQTKISGWTEMILDVGKNHMALYNAQFVFPFERCPCFLVTFAWLGVDNPFTYSVNTVWIINNRSLTKLKTTSLKYVWGIPCGISLPDNSMWYISPHYPASGGLVICTDMIWGRGGKDNRWQTKQLEQKCYE